MRRHSLISGLLLLGLVLAGCGSGNDATAAIELTLEEQATPHVGPATVRFRLDDTQTGQPVTGAAIKVEGNMTHPGMAPSLAEATEVAAGTYEAEINYTMRGDWYLFFDIRLADGQTLTRQVDVPGVTE